MVFSSTLGSSSHEALVKFKKHSARVALAYVWCKSWASFLIPGIPARFIFRWGYGNWGWCLKVHTSDHEWSKMATSDHERPNMTMSDHDWWVIKIFGNLDSTVLSLSLPRESSPVATGHVLRQNKERRREGGREKFPGARLSLLLAS